MTSLTLSSPPLRRSPIRIYSIYARKLLLHKRKIFSSQSSKSNPKDSRIAHPQKLMPVYQISRLRTDCVSLATGRQFQALTFKTIARKTQRCSHVSELSQVQLRSQAIWCLARVNLSHPPAHLADLTHSSWWTTHRRWQTMHRTSLRAYTVSFLQQEVRTWITEKQVNTYINYD